MTKIRKITASLLMVVMSLCFCFIAYTTAKYVVEKGNSGDIGNSNSGSTIGADIPFGMLNKVEVTSQEDLFNALENGYPYIALSDDVRDPLIVTQATMDVKKSLILDLNGKSLQRISANAMLNVPEGVTLTIIDSNAQKTGGLYNPVGTVLQVSGGSLDVRGGKFESGPRTWEYFTDSKTNRIPATQADKSVVYYTKDNYGNTLESTKSMPIISPTVNTVKDSQGNETVTMVDGNIYFDNDYQSSNDFGKLETKISADTYCYYVTSDNFTSGMTTVFDQTVADFAYSYYAKPVSYDYIGYEEPTSGEYVQVTVYGFSKNIQTAMGRRNDVSVDIGNVDLNNAPYYAAINMQSGTLDINFAEATLSTTDFQNIDYKTLGAGSFISYFGVETTSCIQFTGGTMNVSTGGIFATVNPQTIKDINENALAVEGRGICVHNNGKGAEADKGTLNVKEGNFLSFNMSTVRLEEGLCYIDNSNFYRYQNTLLYKNGNEYNRGQGTVYSQSGTIEIKNSNFNLNSARPINDINDLGSTQEEIENKLDTRGVYGIYSAGGNISIIDTVFTINGDGARGVFLNQNQGGKNTLTGNINVYNTSMTITGNHCWGIFTRGGMISVDSSGASGTSGYKTKFEVSGNDVMGVYANTPTTQDNEVNISNAEIIVNSTNNNAGDFNVGVDILNANISFTNAVIKSCGYGATLAGGVMNLKNVSLESQRASSIIVSNGTVNANGKINISCNVDKTFVDGIENAWNVKKENKALLKTYMGIDIQNGLLNIAKDDSLSENKLIYNYNSDVVTPENKNRIGDGKGNNVPYVINEKSPVFDPYSGAMQAASAFLPASMFAVRVVGENQKDALNINADCEITSKVGGGMLVRGGNVNLDTNESNLNISITTQGQELYTTPYDFMGKNNWRYYDSKTGGDALFVSGGNVVSKADNLKLEAAHGNGLLVTGADIRPDENNFYAGQIKIADGSATNPAPTVTIDSGTFIGNASSSISSSFLFTGASSNYGVKVVCGGNVAISGGRFEGYGGLCTMGSTSNGTKSVLVVNGDYRNERNRITMDGKRDVACFYNSSDVTINSVDNPDARISSSSKYDYQNASDFGVAIPNGINTAFVIESKGGYESSTVRVNGGYYRATAGDSSGAKAFWCGNSSADLIINGGWYIGSSSGGAIQQYSKLSSCVLNGGYFANFGSGAVLTGRYNSYTLGSGKKIYRLTTSNGYFAKSTNTGTISNSAVYVQ